MFRLYGLVAIALFSISLAGPAAAQLLAERVDGLQRVCVYAPRTNLVTTSARREHRVGLGQNCPASYPTPDATAPPPPSALLRSESVADGSRACVYGQAGTTWTLTFELNQPCPLYAGLATQQRRSPPPAR